ncbi:MAG: TRAP transporter substrate-binding protein DctP [Elusimicrobia bacterium]|nr:TRAP transporter substrate-binding protein DctP [Elusimicrobiota bacterium]
MWKNVHLLSAVAAFTFLCSSPSSAARYNIRWVMSHEPSATAEEAATDFATQVERESKGDIHVEVLSRTEYQKRYGDGRPMSPLSVMWRNAAGDFEMCQTYSYLLGQYHRDLYALGVPYLFRDYDHAERVLDGPLGAELRESLVAKSSLRGLAFTYSGGFGLMSLVDREARRPRDFRRLRIKVGQGGPHFGMLAKRLEIDPIITPPEAYLPLVKAGMADGIETTFARLEELQAASVTRSVTNTEHFLLTTMIVVNEKYFQTLPENYQALLRRAAIDVARKERAATIKLNASARKKIEAGGIKVIDLTADERAEFRRVLEPSDAELGSSIPKTVVRRIRETQAGPITAQQKDPRP